MPVVAEKKAFIAWAKKVETNTGFIARKASYQREDERMYLCRYEHPAKVFDRVRDLGRTHTSTVRGPHERKTHLSQSRPPVIEQL